MSEGERNESCLDESYNCRKRSIRRRRSRRKEENITKREWQSISGDLLLVVLVLLLLVRCNALLAQSCNISLCPTVNQSQANFVISELQLQTATVAANQHQKQWQQQQQQQFAHRRKCLWTLKTKKRNELNWPPY